MGNGARRCPTPVLMVPRLPRVAKLLTFAKVLSAVSLVNVGGQTAVSISQQLIDERWRRWSGLP